MNDFQRRAPGGAPLPADEIHLWLVDLDPAAETVAGLWRHLSADERERAERFRFDRHRRQYAVGRGALRELLGGYLGMAPAEVRFTYGPRGKPFLDEAQALQASRGETARQLFFNLSNSNELALVGFLRGFEIGVDIEFMKPMDDLEQIAERFFSVSERDALRGLPAIEKPTGFFNCWTRKEAYLKAVGEGLAAPLDSFDVTLLPGDTPRMLTLEGDAERAARWYFQSFQPAERYIGALAVLGLAGPAEQPDVPPGAAWPVRTYLFSPEPARP